MQKFVPPKVGIYTPIKLSYTVTVLATRELFGRTEYEIQSTDHPDSGTAWVGSKYLTIKEAP